MHINEARGIWKRVTEKGDGPYGAVATGFSRFPPGGLIEVAEAFALCYLDSDRSPELLQHFRDGLALMSCSAPDHYVEIAESSRSCPTDARDAYFELLQGYIIAHRPAVEWFERRISFPQPAAGGTSAPVN